jgi:hypothetical protein
MTGVGDGPPATGAGRSTSVTASHLWNVLGSVVAPATLVSALLFYFGYVSTRAKFEYFGVDVDAVGFSSQEFVMRATRPLLVPALVLLLASAASSWGGGVARRRLRARSQADVRRLTRALARTGAGLLLAGVVLLLGYPVVGSGELGVGWREPYDVLTPALLGLGAGLVALATYWAPGSVGAGRTTVVLLLLVVVASVFWATATVARWSGLGEAKELARDLTVLPAVVVDTADPLFPRDPVVVESVLPQADQQTYRYRYRGLRLLAEGDGRLFLVPERWSPSGSTFAVALDEVRIRFRFVDDPPTREGGA